MNSNEKIRKLRRMCPPPSWENQSAEAVEKWRNL
jgi:hypothetical protein